MNRAPICRLLVASFAALALTTASIRSSHAANSFTRSDVETENNPFSVVASDLNRDGILDLAVTGFNDPSVVDGLVSVFLGNGDGTFRPRTNFPCGTEPLWVAAGDVNLDGTPDLLAANYANPGSVSVLLGIGDGSFSPAVDFQSGIGPHFVAIADVNADGRPDAIVGTSYNTVFLHLGNGDGTFGPPVNLLTTECQPRVLIADLNTDTYLDLAVIDNCSPVVRILLGNGDGTFQASVDYPVSSYPFFADAGDLNADGHLDLVISISESSVVSVLMGNGDGTFLPKRDFKTGIFPIAVKIGDFASDGIPDLAVSVLDGNSLDVLAGHGDGTFEPKYGFPTGFSWALAAGDWNRDGFLDLAVSDIAGGTELPGHVLSVFLNTPGVPVGNPPVVTAPATISGNPNSLITFTVSATDPDGDPILSLRANSLPEGATFTANPSNTSGTFSWTPDSTRGMNVWQVIFIASNNLTGSAATEVRVNTPPVLETIADMTVSPASTADQGITATHGDADAITFTASLPSFATLTSDPQSGYTRTGTIHVAPPLGTSGIFNASVTATASGLPDTKNFLIRVVDSTNHAPVLAALGNKSGSVGTPLTFTATATDADVPANTLTFSLDPDAPAGATIGASSGVFTWTPGSTGTFPVTIRVTDNGSPALSDFEAIAILVGGPPSQAPVLGAIGNRTVNEQALLAFTATATDPDAGQTLTFSLTLGSPSANGATINSSTGAFAWTPAEVQGPGNFPITVRVTDNGSPPLSDSEAITVTVNEVNSVPFLASTGDKATALGAALTFTVTAADNDVPMNVLTFSLDPGAPAGATINSGTGVFNWTPASTGTFPVTIRVTDNGPPPLSAFEVIRITVCSACGSPPVLASIGSRSVTELALLSFTATATDPDAGQTLTFSLGGSIPAGAAIGGTTGAFTWTPTEAQGPGSYSVTVRVTDSGSPPLSDSEAITINVIESNSAPVLAAIGNKSGTAGTLLSFTPTATDSDLPVNTLTFSLDPGAPAGATIGANGNFAWTPTCGQAGTYPVTIRVTDNGAPPLSDFEVIAIAVSGSTNQPPVLGAIGNKSVTAGNLLSFTATATDADLPANVLTFSLDPGAPSGATIGAGGNFTWTPTCGQVGSHPVTIRVSDNGCAPLSDFEAIAITVSGPPNQPPVLGAIGNKTVNEGSLLSFTATATDADAGQTLTFLLDAGAPAGAAINGTSGVFSWTPAETQGAGSYPITVRVTDSGCSPVSDFEAFTVVVNEVNLAPVLAAIGDRFLAAGTRLTFTATATDADFPANSLTFSLDPGAPAGATIGASSGAFDWTPPTAGTFPVTIRVTDNGTPALSDFEIIQLSVCSSCGGPPVLAAIGNKTTNELSNLAFTATATDPDAGQTLTFSLTLGTPAATGATIVGSTGGFSWTPTEAQGPGVYPITVRVTDNFSPPLSDIETIQVTVNETNSAPVLAAIGNKTGSIGTPVTFTATATDADVPANTLTFSLDAGAPSGATIGASTGAFSWTPTTSGTFPFTIRVTDNGTPSLSDFEAISITMALGSGQPPVLAAIGNKTVNELALLAFTATASDPDAGQTLTFSLDAGAPGGATINASSGAFAWTPTEAQAPGVYPITVRVTDNGGPPQSDFETISVTINEVNTAPVVTNPGNKTTAELANLAYTATATDTDIPANTITWSLTLGTPAATGATIGSGTGAFNWTPTEAQGPGVYPVTVTATDNGSPAMSGTAAFTVTVNEVNSAPVLAPIGNLVACLGQPVTFTATATDADIPANTLTFSLDAGAPPGATIGATTGAFSWTPTTFGTFPITVRVTDNGTPAMSDFEAIAFAVPADCSPGQPVLAPIGNRTVNEVAQLAFTATATDPDPGAMLTFSLDPGAPAGATIQGSTGAFSWTPTEAQGPGSYPITVRVTNDSSPPLSDVETITVTVREVNAAPVLAPIGNKIVGEGSLLAFTATATDADIPANALCFSLDSGSPPGTTMNCGTGAFAWTPSQGQAGTYSITVRVMDNGLPPLSDFETITVLVFHVDAQPHADAGGPYSGIVNAAVNFDGTGSSDPSGDVLTYAWDFGDGDTGMGATPMHVYMTEGNYNVTLRVTDPDGNYDDDVTTVTIRSEVSVTLVLKNGKSTLSLGDRDVLKVGIEELELPYTGVLVGTVRLSTDFPNAGTVAECAADPKHTRIGDLDRNGIPDLEVRFPIACVRNLFRNTPNNSAVNLILTGEFETATGTVPLRGVKVVTIKTSGGSSAPVLAYPNPLNPQGTISFVTGRPGTASIQLFDLQGRLVRTLLPEQYLGPGVHEVAIDGRNDQGLRLSSGVYFYRVSTADGITDGSVSILK